MDLIKQFCLTAFLLIKQVCLFPGAVVNAVRQSRSQAVLNNLEAERLDRIRNPSKYLGR